MLTLLDALAVVLALFGAYLVRFAFVDPSDPTAFAQPADLSKFAIPTQWYRHFLLVVPYFIAVRVILFWAFRLYRGILRYASTSELLAILLSTSVGTMVLAGIDLLVVPLVPAIPGMPLHNGHLHRVPLMILPVEFAFTVLLVGAIRFSRRLALSLIYGRASDGMEPRRVLIVGAGDAGEAVARQMKQSLVRAYIPVAFVDDDAFKHHRSIHGIPVAGFTTQIHEVIERHDVEDVLIAIPGIAPAKLREIVQQCEHAKVSFKILPSFKDVLTGKFSVSEIRPVEIEDLLGREEVRFELSNDRNYIQGQTILITGAGGSIGSELCRQLLRFGPQRIVLFGHGENSIYEIAAELKPRCGPCVLVPVIGDIRDEKKLRSVIAEVKPTIFFHAAAHKHVPLMEMHPDEAIKNNVLGTWNVARAAEETGARKFILISSDKAVCPTSVMGASKRVAEMVIFCMAKTSRTQFVAVRFGNVLGSRGSVIPLFRRQIARGGPVTITHPDVTRYFMTIPEAVALVVQAGAKDEQGRLFLLDMGQPVKIVDLARNLIRLSGFEPDRDIRIEFTGLRPGEKLIEELLTAGENVKATDIGKIFSTQTDPVDCTLLWESVEKLIAAAEIQDAQAIRRLLRQLIPDAREPDK